MKEQTVRSLGSLLILFFLNISLQAADRGSDIIVTLHLSQESVYVGEPFDLEVVVKKRTKAGDTSPMFTEPLMKDLWIKRVTDHNQTAVGDYTLITRVYTVSAQRSGSLAVAPMEVKLAYQRDSYDAWGNLKEERYWQHYYSNGLEIEVKKLPEETRLVGEFSIVLEAAQMNVDANRALTAEVVVEGFGNFEDISFEIPSVFGVDLFSGEPILQEIGRDKHQRWVQTLTFVGANDFTIPSIELLYFDLQEKAVKRIVTEAVFIDVKEERRIDDIKVIETDDYQMFRWYLLGFIGMVGSLVVLLNYVKRRARVKKVSYRDEKAVLHLLLGHREDEGVTSIIEALEASIYEGKSDTVDLKELKRLLKKYQ